jgi:O-antigen biosynthesis protein
MNVFIKMAQPMNSPSLWGDFHYAYALKKALQNCGISSRVLFHEDLMLKVEVEIVLLGLNMAHYRPPSDAFSVAWLISHPEQNDVKVLRSYRFAFVCSKYLSSKWGFEYLPQAYDSDAFDPEQPADPRYLSSDTEIAFVGNVRTTERLELLNALGSAFDNVHVWGNYHNGSKRVICHRPVLPLFVNHIYRSAKVVVGHHLSPARETGLINDRVFSAIASGAFFLSDGVLGARDVFPELVTYSSPQEAIQLCGNYLEDDFNRRRVASACKSRNKDNTFHHRARRLCQLFSNLN